ncbi:MAG TPA: hypothetical protein VIZ18_11790 [Ktedonobacteraceae bacterium]
MELIGCLVCVDGCYWVYNQAEEWVWPFEVGECAEVLVSGQWLAMTMHSGGYRGRYLRAIDGRWLRPALCMQVRVGYC